MTNKKNRSKLIRFSIGSALALSAFIMTSCDLDDNNEMPQVPVSYVSIYNAVPDAPDLGVIVDSRQLSSYPFRYADNTGYLRFYTGSRDIKVGPYGANNVVADTTVTLLDDNAYSIFVTNEYNKASLLIVNDSAAVPAAGKANVRLINLSPDASPVTLRIKDDTNTLIGTQAFKGVSDFVQIDPDDYDFEVVSSDGSAPIKLSTVSVQEGSARTIIVRGYRTPPSGNTNVISGRGHQKLAQPDVETLTRTM